MGRRQRSKTIACWRCGLEFKTWPELFEHKEKTCTEIAWSDYAEHH